MANPTLATFVFRKIFILTFSIVIGFSSLSTCEAQSVVGKWKGVSVQNYYSPEYARQIGKSSDEKLAKDVGNSEIIYQADHTFIMNISATTGSDIITIKGVWAVTLDQLSLTVEPKYNPSKTTTMATFTIHGNTMETTAILPPPSRIVKTVSVATRI
jgi:hypothetical protein